MIDGTSRGASGSADRAHNLSTGFTASVAPLVQEHVIMNSHNLEQIATEELSTVTGGGNQSPTRSSYEGWWGRDYFGDKPQAGSSPDFLDTSRRRDQQ